MAYENFQNVESGIADGTIKGLLPLDADGARAFAYRKEITVNVFLDLSLDSAFEDLTGSWQVRLRENHDRGEDKAYTGAILFEQTMTWTARVVVDNQDGVSFITWGPLDDGGSGSQQTSIVGLQPCSTIENVNAATTEELAAYGENGAWRFLDLANVSPDATPAQKYDAEKGLTIFENEGVAASVGYNFFAAWKSPYYECELPQGAILETVFDTWQNPQPTEALYNISWEKGESGRSPFFVHPNGFLVSAIREGENTKIESRDGSLSGKNLLSSIENERPISIHRDSRTGLFYFCGKAASGAHFFRSCDDGRTWELMGMPFDNSYRTQDALILFGGIQQAVATKDGCFHIVNSYDGGVTWETPEGFEPVPLPTGFSVGSLRQKTVMGKDTLVFSDSKTFHFESGDTGATWEKIT